ncbi:MAG: CheR family methyltransferase [Acidobacteriota bacterium]
MAVSQSDILLEQVAETLKAKTGLRFHSQDDLRRGLQSAAREMNFDDWTALALWLLSSSLDRCDIETLARHLTIGETYFFRDPKAFEFLEQTILPEIARNRSSRRIRVWSAGCSTGEEAYSIAISIQKAIPDWKQWNITLMATDIHTRLIERARGGVYRQWSFRNCPDHIKQLYFMRRGDDFEIHPSIREMVSFDYLNLAEDIYPSLATATNAMDVIFCRNVLMYFDEETARRAIDSFHRCLVDGGWLVAGATDAPSSLYSRFHRVSFQGAILYKKTESAPIASLPIAILPKIEIGPSPPLRPVPIERRERIEIPVAENPLQLARRFYDEGRYREAIREIEKTLSRRIPGSETMAMAARCLANEGRLEEAREWCEKALDRDKLNTSLHYLLAVIAEEQGKAEDAIRALSRALYIDKDFVMAHFKLGGLKLRAGRREESRKHFQNAILLLASRRDDETLPESEGITVARLKATIESIMEEWLR